MKPNELQIEIAKKRLRELIDRSDDLSVVRIAQSMEYALQWATEETVGWMHPVNEARAIADILNGELIKG